MTYIPIPTWQSKKKTNETQNIQLATIKLHKENT